MATMIVPRLPKNVARQSVGTLRTEYNILAEDYTNVVNGVKLMCPMCGEWKKATAFYMDNRTATGRFWFCNECVLEMACDYDKTEHVYVDNREKTIKMMEMLDLPFIEHLYGICLNNVAEDTGERKKPTAFQSMVTMIKSLPAYKGKTWKDSDFVVTEESNTSDPTAKLMPNTRTIKKSTIRLFGEGYSDEDYWFLQTQYEDWCSRVQVDTKSQEVYVTQICLALLDISKSRLKEEDVTKKLSSLDSLMNSANLQPKQNVDNASSDTLTFGQLIQKWEDSEPIPEPDPELQDVDGIGRNIRVWFGGWLAHALGLKTPMSEEYLQEISKYQVTRPEESDDTEAVHDALDDLFGDTDA